MNNILIIASFLFIMPVGFYVILLQNKKLKTIQNKKSNLYHDINSSVATIKMTLESLRDFSDQLENKHDHSYFYSLIDLLEEGTCQIEGSIRQLDI